MVMYMLLDVRICTNDTTTWDIHARTSMSMFHSFYDHDHDP